MSSKYSEFRKNKQIGHDLQNNSSMSMLNQFNFQEIDKMMQVLTVPLALPKEGQSLPKREPKSPLSSRVYQKYSSRKNSQTNQTCDLTTTVDQQSTSISGNEKLPILVKNSSKRHYTEQELSPKNIVLDLEKPIRTQFQFDTNQSLLDDPQQKPDEFSEQIIQSSKIQPQPESQFKPKPQFQHEDGQEQLLNKIVQIHKKLQTKCQKLTKNEVNILLQKLNDIGVFIDQL